MAMAYRAGVALQDMEFVQFHPTALCLPNAPAFMLTEALRGEGAVLRNKKGEAFMPRHHSAKELAPRDVVTRAIWTEMQSEPSTHVYLDATHLDKAFLKKRFPMIHKTCLSFGMDLTQDPIPVSPAAHFMIGGVKTDLHGATTLRGLFAVGEVACTQVHGANRLGSNSLLEGLVFGARAGKAALRHSSRYQNRLRALSPKLTVGFGGPQDISDKQVLEIQQDLRRAMWEKAGIVRSEKSLQDALAVSIDSHNMLRGRHLSRSVMETLNMATVAALISLAALQRLGSVGVHFRSDYPKNQGENWLEHHVLDHRNTAFNDLAGLISRKRTGVSL